MLKMNKKSIIKSSMFVNQLFVKYIHLGDQGCILPCFLPFSPLRGNWESQLAGSTMDDCGKSIRLLGVIQYGKGACLGICKA